MSIKHSEGFEVGRDWLTGVVDGKSVVVGRHCGSVTVDGEYVGYDVSVNFPAAEMWSLALKVADLTPIPEEES